jgi:hypothetical protein
MAASGGGVYVLLDDEQTANLATQGPYSRVNFLPPGGKEMTRVWA